MIHTLDDLLATGTDEPVVLQASEAGAVARRLADRLGLAIYPQSLVSIGGALLGLASDQGRRALLMLLRQGVEPHGPVGFEGEIYSHALDGAQISVWHGPCSGTNAAALRRTLPYLRPQRLGLATSVGCGDRLGLATPGHIRAVRGTGLRPILAQQSMRENARTGRTPQQVVDDATWGVFQEGWTAGYGADADHLKLPEHIDWCLAAGYTFFTIDPGDHVNNAADGVTRSRLIEIVSRLPWADLETTPTDLEGRYSGRTFDTAAGIKLYFDGEKVARAVGKYGAAIAHTTAMYRHLAGRTSDFELEISVDETESVTTPEEHFFLASELRRLGVRWVSLAPRYVGRFEKGVDYLGDLEAFTRSFAQHVAIAQDVGPYKLSLHSGSDKFSIYPIAARLAGGLVHLKTAGTSYLEALRVIAALEPELFRAVLALSLAHYETDRATYHVSAQASRVPAPDLVSDTGLAVYLAGFDARQVLHVTFGRVLNTYGEAIKAALVRHEESHYSALESHFRRHLAPFADTG